MALQCLLISVHSRTISLRTKPTLRHANVSKLHSLIDLSPAPLTIIFSCCENRTLQIPLLCPLHVPTRRIEPVAPAFSMAKSSAKTLMSLSAEPETRKRSFTAMSMELMSFSCARIVVSERSLIGSDASEELDNDADSGVKSHILMVRSCDPVIKNRGPLPVCLENATAPIASACPSQMATQCQSPRSFAVQIRTVLSFDPLASHLRSEEADRHRTVSVCPGKSLTSNVKVE
jgi:hypothetical protein